MLLKNIKRLCEEKGITIARLERETGISNGTISRWEMSSPSVENARKVAEYFGRTVDELAFCELTSQTEYGKAEDG